MRRLAQLSLLVAALSYFLWRGIPSGMQERKIAYIYQPIMNIMDAVTYITWKLGYDDIYWTRRFLFQKLHRPVPINESDSYPVKVHNEVFNEIPVRIYEWKPRAAKKTGAIIFIHGGGYVSYSPIFYDPICIDMIHDLQVPIISIDYRLAPQYQSPIAFTDSLKAVSYFLKEIKSGGKLESLNVDADKIIYMGDSAGGHITTVVVQQLVKKESQLPKPKAAVIIYPITQTLTINTPSYLEHENGFVWNRRSTIWALLAFHQGDSQQNFYAFQANNFSSYSTREKYADQLHLPQLKNRATDNQGHIIAEKDGDGDKVLIEKFRHLYENEMNSPLLGDLTRFPPSLVTTCELDPLRDDGEMLVKRLRDLGRPVEHTRYHSVHGILSLDKRRFPQQNSNQPLVELSHSQAMYKRIIDFVKNHL